ncbi:hypothetical protein OROMI_033985 [Orobanche minor]
MMMIGSNRDTTPNSPLVQSKKGSCNLGPFSQGAHKEDGEYELYVEDPRWRLVAYGRIHNLGSTIHHRQMNVDEARVVVIRVVVGDARVPCPMDEVTTVEEAPNNFIA